MATPDAPYLLYYWPGIPGRGELVRMVLEQAGAPYDDVARRAEEDGGGVAAILASVSGGLPGLRPFAPPVLVHGEHTLSQVANICAYLGARHGLVPDDEGSRLAALQLQLTLTDLVAETHDTHHPMGPTYYYEEQKVEARRYTRQFVDHRMPKYLGYFEAVLEANARGAGRHLVGEALSYVDLTAAQVVRGLEHAFPRACARYRARLPRLCSLRDHVDALPRIAAYRASARCLPFNLDGIFRHHPELDIDPNP